MRDQVRRDEQSERQFRGYDRNGDGYLNEPEIQTTQIFKTQWQKWDANQDGKITLEEWRAYMSGGATAAPAAKGPEKTPESAPAKATTSGGVDVITIDEGKRNETWRAGKLPDLPPWFKECDKNQDGQVAMYEWKAKDKPLPEFIAMDGNDDGLLTPDEVVRFLRQAALAASRTNGQNGQTPPAKDETKGKKRK
jgi:Ca2+-binding EF-hand superfamily protein